MEPHWDARRSCSRKLRNYRRWTAQFAPRSSDLSPTEMTILAVILVLHEMEQDEDVGKQRREYVLAGEVGILDPGRAARWAEDGIFHQRRSRRLMHQAGGARKGVLGGL